MGVLNVYFDRIQENMENGEVLFRAAIEGDVDAVRVLVRDDPSVVRFVDPVSGNTALHVFTYDGNYEGASVICSSNDAPLDVQDSSGRWCALIATTLGRDDIRELLDTTKKRIMKATRPFMYWETYGESDGEPAPPGYHPDWTEEPAGGERWSRSSFAPAASVAMPTWYHDDEDDAPDRPRIAKPTSRPLPGP